MFHKITSLFLCLISVSTAFGANLDRLISRKSDAGFGGYYLRIDRTMEALNISRLQAHEIQNQLRDSLENTTGSYSRLAQKEFLQREFEDAIDAVLNRGQSESGYVPIDFKTGEFVVVFDLDETLLTHWFLHGTKIGSKREGSIFHRVRDSVLQVADRKTGDSLKQACALLSPNVVQVRPGVEEMARILKASPGFRGFVIFTAKEDQSTWDVIRNWRSEYPEFFSELRGVFTRNYLRLNWDVSKPSKDLRIIDPSLRHVFLVDDNESRVMQKHLNYRIPKFNADAYIESLTKKNSAVTGLNKNLLPFLARKIQSCAIHGKGSSLLIRKCFERNLGRLSLRSEKHLEISNFYSEFRARYPVSEATLEKMFHQPFVFALKRNLSESFPRYKNHRLLDRE